jgi:DNA-binding NarL/FixJ family response regulator
VDSVQGALSGLLTNQVDAVIVDLNVDDMCGLGAIPLILEKAPSSKVILLIDQDDHRYYEAAAKKGACACVRKHLIATELVPTLYDVLENCRRSDLP